LVPQVVPSATLEVKEHVDAPVAQDVMPFWQGLLDGLQAVPAVQGEHDPLLHTSLVPHVMPLAALRGLVHTDVPVAHEVVPVWQLLEAGVQPTFAVHITHCPPLQTWLVPHTVPSATFIALPQVAVPEEQSVVPVWQTLPPGLHCVPDWQAPHVPLLQTACIDPRVQVVPFASCPVCVQTAEPVLQLTVPVRQGLPPGRHDDPLLQATHPPSLHTSLVPQGWPLGTAVAASGSQNDEPVPHVVRAVWHWLPPGLQFEPVVQELQLPWPSQTWFRPHEVPAGALVFRSVQMSAPLAHEDEPRWQGLPPGMQGAPAVHTWQPPSAVQNLFMSHCVPGGAYPASMQTGDPVEQAITAWPQEPVVAQLWPMGQPTHWPLLQTAPASHWVPTVSWPRVRHVVTPASEHAVTPMTQASGAHCMPGMHGGNASSLPSSPASRPVSAGPSAIASA
jgi:hypothetical protein